MNKIALILDLDNTLYNWMDAYASGLNAQIDYISKFVPLTKKKIENKFKKVFLKYGEVEVSSKSLMAEYAFPEMEKCDMLIVEFSEKGVGLGVGAGYAFAKNIPIYIIAKTGSDISSTIGGLAKEIIFYDKED